MFITGESLEDIEAWAEATFPAAFKATKAYLELEKIDTCKKFIYRPSASYWAITAKVGTTANGTYFVYACIRVNTASVAYILDDNRDFQHLNNGSIYGHRIDASNANFMPPFCWLVANDLSSEVWTAALVHYSDLRSSGVARRLTSIVSDVETFKKGFQEACHVIADALRTSAPPTAANDPKQIIKIPTPKSVLEKQQTEDADAAKTLPSSVSSSQKQLRAKPDSFAIINAELEKIKEGQKKRRGLKRKLEDLEKDYEASTASLAAAREDTEAAQREEQNAKIDAEQARKKIEGLEQEAEKLKHDNNMLKQQVEEGKRHEAKLRAMQALMEDKA